MEWYSTIKIIAYRMKMLLFKTINLVLKVFFIYFQNNIRNSVDIAKPTMVYCLVNLAFYFRIWKAILINRATIYLKFLK